jgi:hypothetical protein
MQRCPCSFKRVCTTWGISGDVCYICILCFSTNTLTMIASDCLVRTDYGYECVLPPTIHTPSIFDELFLLVRNV